MSSVVINKLGGLIGKGSFGDVVLATGADGRTYAAKKIPVADVQATFTSEIVVFEMLESHQNIVKYYGHFELDKSKYIILEYCEIGSLNDYVLRKENALENYEVSSLFLDVAKGLAFLHSNQVLHRDLKTENILVTKDDTTRKIVCKLTDFGISKWYQKQKLMTKIYTCKVHGTPYFMAPEVRENQDGNYTYVSKSDVFSLGAVYLAVIMKTKVNSEDRDVIAPFYVTQNKTKHSIADAINFGIDVCKLAKEVLSTFVRGELADLVGSMLHAKYRERPDIEFISQRLEAIDLDEFLERVTEKMGFTGTSLEEPCDETLYRNEAAGNADVTSGASGLGSR